MSNLDIKKAVFHKSATDPSQFPNYPYPEFAFFGRSNTGKSSLISYLLGGKVFVKTGSRPGHTQTVNYFVVNENMSIADLPGFGYAKAPAHIREGFLPMIKRYINERENLRIGFLLVDSRREPEVEELEIIKLLTARKIPTAIVATKADKLTRNEMANQLKKIARAFGIEESDIFPTSSLKKTGKDQIISLLAENAHRQ